jgi:hypothetical protein
MEYYGCPPDVLVSLQACTPGGRLGVCPPSTGHLGSEAFCMCACDSLKLYSPSCNTSLSEAANPKTGRCRNNTHLTMVSA